MNGSNFGNLIIEDFTPISKLKKLEILEVSWTNFSDISLLEKLNIKELNSFECYDI